MFEVGEDQREAAQEASGALELPAITTGSATTRPSSSSAAVAAIGPQWNHLLPPGTRAVPGRRRRGGLKAWLQRLGDHPGEEQLAEFDSEFPKGWRPRVPGARRLSADSGSRRPSLVRTTSAKPA